MGNVVSFADSVARLKKQAQLVANDGVSAVKSDDGQESPHDSIEGTVLFKALGDLGVNVVNDETLRDFNTVINLVRGMKDRQSGNTGSENCAMLECMGQAFGYHKDVTHDDSFDDLLSKLD